MMEENLDYATVPTYFVHCFSSRCPRAAECLRHLAGRHVAPSVPVLRTVNPTMCPDEQGGYPQFRPLRKVRMAWGVRKAIDRLPHGEVKGVVNGLNRMFSKATLNRITTHQRPLSPEEQKAVEALFVRCGVADGEVFDRIEMRYEW